MTTDKRGKYFNPRSHEGSDAAKQNVQVRTLIFQSTLPRGERLVATVAFALQIRISIHAPTRGATAGAYLGTVIITFQSTLPRGERRICYLIFGFAVIFQSTLPRGERRLSAFAVFPALDNFNPRSHEGSDTGGR